MQAYHLTASNLGSLSRVDIDDPRPAAGEVLIRLRAASLNYLDFVVARGDFGDGGFPLIPVTDGAGVVAALGEGVEGWQVGDRVVPHYLMDWTSGPMTAPAIRRMRGVTAPGSAAEFAVVPATSLVALPPHLSFAEGATLPIAATTAWNALKAAQVTTGSTVALLGTGGVSLFALQFAKAMGARVIITSSSDTKLERARALGADETVSYRASPGWDAEILRLTDGTGADLVVETVGTSTFTRSITATAVNGTIVVVGFVSGTEVSFPVIPMMMKRLHIVGSQTGSVADFREALQAVSAARIVPVIDRVFGFDAVAAAYAYLGAGGHIGKVAIDLDAA